MSLRWATRLGRGSGGRPRPVSPATPRPDSVQGPKLSAESSHNLLLIPAFPHRPPDQAGQNEHGRGEGTGEQPERAVKNRFALHLYDDGHRAPVEPIREMLFPGEDVAAACLGRLVGLEIPCRMVQDP